MNRLIVLATVVLATIVAPAYADKASTTIPASKVYTFEPLVVPRLAELKKPIIRKPSKAAEVEADLQQQDLVRQEALADRKLIEQALAKINEIKAVAEKDRKNPIAAAEKCNREIGRIMADLRKRKPNLWVGSVSTCVVEH